MLSLHSPPQRLAGGWTAMKTNYELTTQNLVNIITALKSSSHELFELYGNQKLYNFRYKPC